MTRDSCVIRFQKRRSLPKEISHKCAISLHHSIHFSSMQSSSAYPAPRGSSGFTASGDKAQWQCDPKWESGVCIYLDNSNIFIEAQRLAVTRNGNSIDLSVRRRIRVDFENLVALCCANRKLVSALAAGSIPPELRNLWSRLEAATGAHVSLFNRGDKDGKERQVADMRLQMGMYKDGCMRAPGVAVVVTGDGAEYEPGEGFFSTLQNLKYKGWKIEALSWRHCINRKMLRWVEGNGIFVALDDFYEEITFLEEERQPTADYRVPARCAKPIDLKRRPAYEDFRLS